MNFTRSLPDVRCLTLIALTFVGLCRGVLRAELSAPPVSAGRYTVSWDEPSGSGETLYLREYLGAALIDRHDVTNKSSMAFCRPNGIYTYRLQLCFDGPIRGEPGCTTLPGEAEVYVDDSLPDEWFRQLRSGPHIRDKGIHAVPSLDGDYVLLYDRKPSFNSPDIYLVKLGRCGKTIWASVLLTAQEEVHAHDLLRLNDGGYLIVGSIDHQLFVLRTTKTGTIIAKQVFGELGNFTRGRSAVQLSADRFLIAGDTQITDYGSQGVLFEVHQAGAGFEIVHGRRAYFGGTGDETVSQVILTADGGYVVVGSTNSEGHGGYDACLAKFSAELIPAWDYTPYGGAQDDYGRGVLQRADGGYVLVGTTKSWGADYSDVYLAETHPDGTFIREKPYKAPLTQTGEAIRPDPSGGYAIAGHGWQKPLFLHIEATTLDIKEHELQSVGYVSYVSSLEPTDTNGWLMAGTGKFPGHVDWEPFILYYKPGEWSGAYRGLFSNPGGITLFRSYRDRVLRSTPRGRKLVEDIYENSRSVLITLLTHPQLMSYAQELLEDNRVAVANVVRGRKGVIEDSEPILAFLNTFAASTQDEDLRALALRVHKMIRQHRGKGQPLFGFELRRDARNEPRVSP